LPLSYDFLSEGHFGKPDVQRLRDHISFLSSPEAGGRLPGTPGYERVQQYLLRALVRTEIQPLLQSFSTMVKDVEEAQLMVLTNSEEENFHVIPFLFSKEGEWTGTCLLDPEEGLGQWDDFHGKAIAFFYCSQCHEEEAKEYLFSKIMDLQLRGAAAILILIKEEDLEPLAPYVTYPSFFPPKIEENLKAKEKEGYFFHRSLEASKIAVRATVPAFPIDIPVLFILQSEADEERIRSLLSEKETCAALHLHFKEESIKDSNIGGILEGQDPELRKECIVLGAHYDHLGQDDKSGYYHTGADDNASDVAALLEIGRLLAEKRDDMKRSLLILFFGGEEWGLLGSRYFAENPLIPLKQLKTMLSLDTIGGSGVERERRLIIGSSKDSSLAERASKYAGRLGLEEGGGIDQMELIDIDKLTDVTRLLFLTVYEMLTEP
jgi:hypothetical protein